MAAQVPNATGQRNKHPLAAKHAESRAKSLGPVVLLTTSKTTSAHSIHNPSMGFAAGAVCDISLNTKLTPEQRERYQNTKAIRDLLSTSKTIAIVGLSTEPTKASNMVASYLKDEGYRIVPVHPKAAEILGEKCYPTVAAIPFPVDIVDVFRPASEVPAIVQDAIRNGAKAVWCQLRIINFPAAEAAIKAGLVAIVDKCIKMEHGRFGGQLHWAGMNTEVITAQRRKR